MSRWKAAALTVYLATAVGVTWLSVYLDQRFHDEVGLTQSFHPESVSYRPLFRRTTSDINLEFLEARPDLPQRHFAVRWSGVWYLRTAQTVDIYLGADDHAALRIDGELVIQRRAGQLTTSRRVSLDAGFHRLNVTYRQDRGSYHLFAGWAPPGGEARPFDPDLLFPDEPDAGTLATSARLRAFRTLVPVLWLAPPLLLVASMVARRVSRPRRWQAAGIAALIIGLGYFWTTYYTHHLPLNALAVALGALPLALPAAFRAERRWFFAYWMLSCTLLVALDVATGVPGGMTDFRKAQYKAGSLLLTTPEYAYDDVCGSYAYLPFSGLLFVPFGIFARDTAYLLYTIVGRLTVLGMTYALARFFQVRDWKLWLLLILIAFNGPLDRILWLGNSTHFILLLLIGAVYALHKRHWALAGVAFGLAPLLKLSMGLLVVYFVLRRNWRVVAAWAGTLTTCVVLSYAIWGVDLNTKWLDTCIFQFRGGAIPAFRAQSIDGFLAKHYLPDTNINDWRPVPVDATFTFLHYLGVLLVMGPAVLAATSRRSRTEPGTTYLEVCIFICAAILISPISWSHYYLFLLLPVAFYAGDRFPRRTWSPRANAVITALFVTAVVLVSLSEEISVEYYDSFDEESSLARLFLSHFFFGGILFYLFLLVQRFTGSPPSDPSAVDATGSPPELSANSVVARCGK